MREPLKVGQDAAPPRGAAACVSQLWTVPGEEGTREEKLKIPFKVEGGPLGDEKRDRRLARWTSILGMALGEGGRRTGTGNGVTLGVENRRERSARRAEEDWSQGNKIGSAGKNAAGPWNGVGSAGRSGCPSIVSQFGFWASQAKKVALSTPFG